MFFFDNTFAPKLVRVLDIMGVPCKHLQSAFSPETKDPIWLERAGDEQWIVITCDRMIRRTPENAVALKNANVISVILPKHLVHHDPWDQIKWFVNYWRKIEGKVIKGKPGDCFRIGDSGTVELMPPIKV